MITAERSEITYRQLRDWIDSLPERKKDLPAHLGPPSVHCDRALPLTGLVACATVEEMLGDDPGAATRSHVDNGHHPGMPVLWWDHHPFAPDGPVGENLLTGERVFPERVPELEAPGG